MRLAIKLPLSELVWRATAVVLLVALPALAVANQIIHPHPRLAKILILLLIMVLMLRLQSIYALFLFILFMPFPSGIALTSTNVILMTLIPLLWVVRATSSRQPLLYRTPLDKLIGFFLIAFLLSFFNAEQITPNVKMLWRQLTALALFYLIVRFVDDERKLSQTTKVVALSSGLLGLTAFIELFAPGAAIIPGWISAGKINYGELGMRIEGIRLGGNVGSHSLLGDYLSMALFFIAFHMVRAKNPIENAFWVVLFGMSLTAVMATANRGAFVALVIGIFYALWVFRRYMNPVRASLVTAGVIALFAGAQFVLKEFTYAASITERMRTTTFEGVVPNNRWGAWVPALQRSMEHIFIGHGAWYDTGRGIEKWAWPHNAYIYSLHTLGLLGLSAMLLIRYRLFKISFDALRVYRPSPGAGTAASLMGILHVLLVMHMLHMGRTDFERPGDFVYIFIVWMLFGLIAATARVLEQSGENAPAGAAASPRGFNGRPARNGG